jgi:hypothetical protein
VDLNAPVQGSACHRPNLEFPAATGRSADLGWGLLCGTGIIPMSALQPQGEEGNNYGNWCGVWASLGGVSLARRGLTVILLV